MTEHTPATPHPGDDLLRVAEAVHAGEVSVTFTNGPTVLAKTGAKLLDIADKCPVHRTLTSEIEIRTVERRGTQQ